MFTTLKVIEPALNALNELSLLLPKYKGTKT